MTNLTLHSMKEIKIVIQVEHLNIVTELLGRVGATGYTIIGNVSGKGHDSYHESHLLFNDSSSLVTLFTVVPEERIASILEGITPLFSEHSGTLFVTDVMVSRREYFSSSPSGSR